MGCLSAAGKLCRPCESERGREGEKGGERERYESLNEICCSRSRSFYFILFDKRLHPQRDDLNNEVLEDLHASSQTENKVKGRLLLDVIIAQGSAIL